MVAERLFNTWNIPHDEKDSRLYQTVQRVENVFDSGKMSSQKGAQRKSSLADFSIICNQAMNMLCNRIMVSSIFETPSYQAFKLDCVV